MIKQSIKAFSQLRTSLLILMLVLVVSEGSAQTKQIRFKRLSIEDGLSQSTVKVILRDREGFMWFGTRDGLNRYDGNKIVIYRHDSKDGSSIRSSSINDIVEDKAGSLWIATDRGIDRFDRQYETFTHYPLSDDNTHVFDIMEDHKGNLWLGAIDGVYKFNFEENRFTILSKQPDGQDKVIFKVFEDDQENIWMCSIWNAAKFDPRTERYQYFTHEPKNSRSLSHGFHPIVYQDKARRLWVGSVGGGLNLYNPDDDSFTKFFHDENNPNSLCHNEILSFQEGPDGKLWVGTQNGGISVFDYEKNKFTTLRQDVNDLTTLSNNSIQALFKDNLNNMWVGTWAGGLSFFPRHANKFIVYDRVLDFKNPNIYDVMGDSEDNIWIGVEDGGLVSYDRHTEKFRYHPNQHADEFMTTVPLSIIEYNKDTIAITYHMGSFAFFDKRTGLFTHFFGEAGNARNPNPNPPIPGNLVGHSKPVLIKDHKNNLWLGDWGNGLNFYDRRTKRFTNYIDVPNDTLSLNGNAIFALCEDREGNVWIGTDKGLNRFDSIKHQFMRYQKDASLKAPVHSILEDRNGKLWVGTSGEGLVSLNKETDQFIRYPVLDGLPNNVINAILEDDKGNLWLGTNKGITKFDPVLNTIHSYDVRDGLQGNEFNRNACYKAPDGTLFFAGVGGFNIFHPDSIFDNPHLPPVVITDFQLFNKSIVAAPTGSVLKKSIGQTNEITLSYAHSVFSFEFAALDFTTPTKNYYAYKLEGFEPEWNYVGNKRTATYTNLDAGHYIFRVKASNNDGIWNEQGTSLIIHILPPWWKTWWFRMSAGLVILGLGVGLYRLRIRGIKIQNRKLEQLVDMRTKELQIANQELVSMEKTKENMLAVMSHEIRTPLNSMIGLTHVLKRRNPRADQIEIIDTLKTSSDHLLHLVNDVLDYNKIQARKLDLEVLRFNMVDILKQLHSMFARAAEEKNIDFNVQVSTSLPTILLGDPTRLLQILSNLVSNAIKFTSKGSVTLYARVTKESEQMCTIEFKVEDTGIGIPEGKLDLLYEPFSQLRPEAHRKYGGSGLGLLIVKNLVEAMKGSVTFESIPDKNTIVTITIPFATEFDLERHDQRINLPNHANLKGLRILYTEDVKSNQFLVKTFLADNEIDCDIANDGAETIAETSEQKFDLILLDVQLPDMDGYEIAARIRSDESSKNKNTPIVLFSAHTGINDEKIKSCGANDVIGKPFQPEDLLLKIERHVTRT